MSNDMNTLFNAEDTDATIKRRSLPGTAQLTTIAITAAEEAMKTMGDDFDTYSDKILAAQEDHNAMDRLLFEVLDFELLEKNADFLLELDDDTIDGMLKSQQSKRSRAKSADEMTLANFNKMLVGAICENIIRKTTGREKTYTTGRRSAHSLEFTDEEIDELKLDQLGLRREIRNIQSKKSIAKKKDGFDVTDEYWLELVDVEAKLKAIRVATPRGTVSNVTKNKLSVLLEGIDTEAMKAGDNKSLLAEIQKLI